MPGPAEPVTPRCPRCGTLTPSAAAPSCERCGAPHPAQLAVASAVRSARAQVLGWPAASLTGLEGALRGAAFVGTHPRLWTWVVAPLLVNAAIFGGLIVLALQAGQSLVPDFSAMDWGWFDALRAWVGPALQVLMTIVAVLAALIATLMVAGVVNAPFYDVLSEHTESLALGRHDPGRPWSALAGDLVFALVASLQLVWREFAIMALLFVLSFTAVGAPLFIVAGFYFTGFSLMDVTLARKRYSAVERRAWARRNASLVTGLGLPVAVIPPLQPFGIVGATLIFLDARDKG